jgi:hypothetical protein
VLTEAEPLGDMGVQRGKQAAAEGGSKNILKIYTKEGRRPKSKQEAEV